ncbi:hypothetical protein MSG28_009700 [Choristoneura fumiferana]|uniref:Uncharacterized protein n=1 Tax=Choristoneura fumiferana TaxID=7141 RepID=A0ACC0JCH3_CHOFU|nr:hypothetical protein MSG28_009700 [Choristoneura fumiferana]
MNAARNRAVKKLKSLCYLTLGGSVAYPVYLFEKDFNGYYDNVLQPISQNINPEWAHKIGVSAIKYGMFPTQILMILKSYTKLLNNELSNPIGIAAGFDKHGDAVIGLKNVGFSIVEIGSVTPESQPGNPKPRVFRLPEDKAVINRYGFNSEGHEQVYNKIKVLDKTLLDKSILGINLGKNKLSDDPVKDYTLDLSEQEKKDIVAVINKKESKVDGLIISNTTTERPGLVHQDLSKEAGGLSGKPLANKSTEMIKEMYRLTKGKVPIIGVGGVFTGQDAYEKILAGASAVQIYTALIYHGPPVVSKIKQELADLLLKNGYSNWLDHVFMIISKESIDDAERELLDCKTLVQHICGQNINLLQSPVYRNWLSVLLDSRSKGDSIPGASGVIGESGATAAALNALKSASKQIKCSPYQHYHLMLFVGDKQLALYSSRGTEDLTPPDLILMSIQCIAAQEYWKEIEETVEKKDDDTTMLLPWLSSENSAIVHLCAGAARQLCAPHSLHVAPLAPRIVLLVLIDMELREVGITTHMSNQILSNLRRLLLQRNLELLPSTLDALEVALKKTTDALRKNKSNASICARLSSRMLELRKSCTTTTPLTPETTATAMHTALETVVDLLKPDIPSLKLSAPLKELKTAIAPYVEFLKIKAMRYFSMGSYPFKIYIVPVKI